MFNKMEQGGRTALAGCAGIVFGRNGQNMHIEQRTRSKRPKGCARSKDSAWRAVPE